MVMSIREEKHQHGASREASGVFYQYASIDVLNLYEMAAKGTKTHKCYNHDGTEFITVDIKKTIDAIGKGKVKLRQVRSGKDAGQQCVCVQDLPENCII